MNSLPLSWSIVEDQNLESTSIINWRINWLAIKNLTSSDFEILTNEVIKSKKDTLIRGCNKRHKLELESNGFSSLHVGYEAILDLDENPFKKKSIIDLIKRGKKFGKVITLPYSQLNKSKLNHFQQLSSHGKEPQLKNLFQMEFNPNHKLNVFCDQNNEWQGAILVSKNSEIKLHTELLLRRKNAPIGIMETLVEYTFRQAKLNGYKYLSLGEVPFAKSSGMKRNFRISTFFRIGDLINFAYNHKGLYHFKNKFNPIWSEVYLCVSNKVNFKHILFLFFHSNLHKLLLYKLFQKLTANSFFFLFKKRKNVLLQLDFNKT
ncbi:MAG: DUF2156 domain-containing protein [Melioribacteraceae bacterium]|nr:DUF2156 domain-containing protein [Melioribacteraceae bacterium]